MSSKSFCIGVIYPDKSEAEIDFISNQKYDIPSVGNPYKNDWKVSKVEIHKPPYMDCRSFQDGKNFIVATIWVQPFDHKKKAKYLEEAI